MTWSKHKPPWHGLLLWRSWGYNSWSYGAHFLHLIFRSKDLGTVHNNSNFVPGSQRSSVRNVPMVTLHKAAQYDATILKTWDGLNSAAKLMPVTTYNKHLQHFLQLHWFQSPLATNIRFFPHITRALGIGNVLWSTASLINQANLKGVISSLLNICGCFYQTFLIVLPRFDLHVSVVYFHCFSPSLDV